jgi:hypothetical protein
LRQSPGRGLGQPLPAAFLKHADEQTVVALAAVFRAVHHFDLAQTCFHHWGVIAASCFLGRATLAVALQRFTLEGAWGVSPHLIPHRSLHSVSGTISQALQVHGPNFGVGGGPGSTSEALLVAGALLARDRLPGLWVVLTGWDAEPVLDLRGGPSANGHKTAKACAALALALAADQPGRPGPRLHVGAGASDRPPSRNSAAAPGRASFNLEALAQVLASPVPLNPASHAGGEDGVPVAWSLDCGGWVKLERDGAGAENGL